MKSETRGPRALIPGLPWSAFCRNSWVGFLGLESRVWSPAFGFMGLDSWVWNPAFGCLAWIPGLDS